MATECSSLATVQLIYMLLIFLKGHYVVLEQDIYNIKEVLIQTLNINIHLFHNWINKLFYSWMVAGSAIYVKVNQKEIVLCTLSSFCLFSYENWRVYLFSLGRHENQSVVIFFFWLKYVPQNWMVHLQGLTLLCFAHSGAQSKKNRNAIICAFLMKYTNTSEIVFLHYLWTINESLAMII